MTVMAVDQNSLVLTKMSLLFLVLVLICCDSRKFFFFFGLDVFPSVSLKKVEENTPL